MITAIFKIKTKLKDVILEGKNKIKSDIGDENYIKEEQAFKHGNTPVQRSYIRVIIEPDVALILQDKHSKGEVSDNMDLVRIEEGQSEYLIGTEDILDEQGKKTGEKRNIYLGFIQGIPISTIK